MLTLDTFLVRGIVSSAFVSGVALSAVDSSITSVMGLQIPLWPPVSYQLVTSRLMFVFLNTNRGRGDRRQYIDAALKHRTDALLLHAGAKTLSGAGEAD